jgi:hypothetical protein
MFGAGGWLARLTGLEPATPGVTGRYSNQLSYNRVCHPVLPEHVGVLRKGAGGVKRPMLFLLLWRRNKFSIICWR